MQACDIKCVLDVNVAIIPSNLQNYPTIPVCNFVHI